MTKTRMVLVALLLVLLSGFISWGCSALADRDVNIASAAVAAALAQDKIHSAQLAEDQKTLVAATETRKTAETKVVQKKAALALKPLPPPRPQASAPEKVAELRARGITSALTPEEVEKIWAWSKSDEELPVVTARLVAAEDVIATQEQEAQAFRVELAAAQVVIGRQFAVMQDRQQQIAGLQSVIAASVKVAKVGKVKQVLINVAVAALSYELGKRVAQ